MERIIDGRLNMVYLLLIRACLSLIELTSFCDARWEPGSVKIGQQTEVCIEYRFIIGNNHSERRVEFPS